MTLDAERPARGFGATERPTSSARTQPVRDGGDARERETDHGAVRMSLSSLSRKLNALFRWLLSTRAMRVVTGGLLRQILAANLLGLALVIIGIFYFSQHNVWLIDAKRESLKVQGEIIAAAIAGDARVDTGRLIIHTDSLPAVEEQPEKRDQGFSSLELSIRPERVAPILRRLIQPTTRRAASTRWTARSSSTVRPF